MVEHRSMYVSEGSPLRVPGGPAHSPHPMSLGEVLMAFWSVSRYLRTSQLNMKHLKPSVDRRLNETHESRGAGLGVVESAAPALVGSFVSGVWQFKGRP